MVTDEMVGRIMIASSTPAANCRNRRPSGGPPKSGMKPSQSARAHGSTMSRRIYGTQHHQAPQADQTTLGIDARISTRNETDARPPRAPAPSRSGRAPARWATGTATTTATARRDQRAVDEGAARRTKSFLSTGFQSLPSEEVPEAELGERRGADRRTQNRAR